MSSAPQPPATAAAAAAPPQIFDRTVLRQHRARAAATATAHDFLFAEVAERLLERLDDVQRNFPLALELGARNGTLTQHLGGRRGIAQIVACEPAEQLVMAATRPSSTNAVWPVAGDEDALPFRDRVFDLVISNLSLHWVNDLPGALIQARRALKPDGFFLAALFGGQTLVELRHSLLDAETALTGGASPRVSPFADLGAMGGLMQRAGFALPVVDSDTLTVTYSDLFRLMADLRGMGESNALRARHNMPTRRAVFALAAERYAARFAEADGRIPATFQIIYLAGWAPHPSQPKPLPPGSATTRLAAVLRPETPEA